MEESILSQSQSLDFSFIALFFKATLTVKVVMLALIFSSIWSWAIIIQKTVDYRKSKREKKIFLDEFWSGGSLEDLYNDKKLFKCNVRLALLNSGGKPEKFSMDLAINLKKMGE